VATTPSCAVLLRQAFQRYAESVHIPCKVRVRSLPVPDAGPKPQAPPVVRIDLPEDDAYVLIDLLHAAAEPGNPTARGPIGSWMGTRDVAHQIRAQPSTIRGWLARHGPKGHPFPRPDATYAGRSYWRKVTIDAWKAEQDRTDAQRRQPTAPQVTTATPHTSRQQPR